MTSRIDIWVESAGLGHVTRQANLMAHLRACEGMANASVRFLIDDRPGTRTAVERAGFEFVTRDPDDGIAFQALFREWTHSAPALFILDSVATDQNPSASLALLHPTVPTTVFIDDPGDRDVGCGLLVNALPSLAPPAPKLRARRALRGVEYLVLPREYAESAFARRAFTSSSEGFAFFGGADLENFTAILLDAITGGSPVDHWNLLLGPAYTHVDAVTERIARSNLPVTVTRHVESMAQTLRSADIAVLAAGNTLSEAAAAGTPAIVLSQNSVQAENARFFAARAGVIDLGMRTDDSSVRLAAAISSLAAKPHDLESISSRMMKTVDGKGGMRIAAILAETMIGGR